MFEKIRRTLQKRCKNMKFSEIADEWLEYKKNTIKESTYCEYTKIIEKNLKPKFKNVKIANITDLNEYIQELSIKFGAKTIRSIISVLKAIIAYYEEKYNYKVKLKKVSLPKISKSKIEIFTKRERKKLENYCLKEQDIKTLGIIIALNTGLRIGEICALQWKDIDLIERKVCVTKTVERIHNSKNKKSKVIVTTPKTETSNRVIPISSKLYEILKIFKKKYKEDYYLLSGTEKIIEPRSYQNIFGKILKDNKIKHRKFHCLRHTFATNCIEVGMDIKSLSEILGHSNTNITLSIYVHSSDKIKKKYLEKI